MERHADVLIIGGGPAGIQFASRLKKLAPEKKVVMLRPEPHSMVYCAIPYAIEGLFDIKKTFKRDEIVTDLGVELVRHAAVSVDLKKRRVVDDKGDVYVVETIFIATGAKPFLPPLPGVEAKNVYTVKTQNDLERIIARIENGARRAVVVGAGAIGIEQAQAYVARGVETYLVEMAAHVLPSMLDAEMAVPVQDVLHKKGVKLILSDTVSKLETGGRGASRVLLSSGKEIELDPSRDFICFAVGMKPDISIFEGQGLEITKDGIVVDNFMRTSLPGIYAAGDCCSGLSLIDGMPLSGKLATNAVQMAKVAAAGVAGRKDEYKWFVNGAATCAGDLRIGATGFTEAIAANRNFKTVSGYGETTNMFPMMPGASNLKVKIVADTATGRILGGQILGYSSVTDKVDIISLAIQHRFTLWDLSHLSYSAQPWQSYFPAHNAIVDACEQALGKLEERNKNVRCVE